MANIDIAQVYDEHFEAVYTYVSFRVSHRQNTEDIVADIFMKVLKKSDTYKPQKGATVRSWLFAITRNTVIDYYRKHSNEVFSIEEVETPDESIRTEHHIDIRMAFEELQPYVNQLPERQREILLLRYTGDLKNKEIAKMLEINERTVSAALSKAITTLRQSLPSKI